jgi:hypothetical protein
MHEASVGCSELAALFDPGRWARSRLRTTQFYDMSETLVDVCPSNEQIAVSDVSSTHNVCAVCNVKSIKGYCQVVPILV